MELGRQGGRGLTPAAAGEGGDEEDEIVRRLLEQEALWRGRRAAVVHGPPRSPAPSTDWDERKLGPKPQHVGHRAQRTDSATPSYLWDEVAEEEQNEGGEGEPDRLFDVFVVVGLQAGEPVVYYRYDATEGPGGQPLRGYEQIQHFCYPNTAQPPRRSMRPETFTFVLTNPKGGRRIGFCRRALPAGEGPRYPEVLCVVSRFPWFSLFAKVLATLADKTPRQAMGFLRAVRGLRIPDPGQRVSVEMPPAGADGSSAATSAGGGGSSAQMPADMVHLVRPDDLDSPFSDVNFVPLFARLSVSHVVTLFGSLLSERRVLLVSGKLSRLSACAHAAVALLYPFSWQHVFIPILPQKMIHLTTAPMPYLMGVHNSIVPELMRMPLDAEPPLLINLDTNSVTEWGATEGQPLSDFTGPAPELVPLLQTTAAHPLLRFSSSNPAELHAAVTEVFRAFFLALFGRYRLFVAGQAEREMPPGTEWRNDTHFFDDEGLTASVPSPAIAHFLREFFFRTQLFDVFITDRLAQAAQGYPPKGVFEREVAELLGNIEMFGDDAPGPFSSGALPSSQAFRRAFRGGGRGGSGAGGSDRRWTAAAAAPTADHADGMPQPTSAVAQIVRGGLNSLAKKLW